MSQSSDHINWLKSQKRDIELDYSPEYYTKLLEKAHEASIINHLVGTPLQFMGDKVVKNIFSYIFGFQWLIDISYRFKLPSLTISLPTVRYLKGMFSSLTSEHGEQNFFYVANPEQDFYFCGFVFSLNNYIVNPINFWAVPLNYIARNIGKAIGYALVSPFTVPAYISIKSYYGIKNLIRKLQAPPKSKKTVYSHRILLDVDGTLLSTHHNKAVVNENLITALIQAGISNVSLFTAYTPRVVDGTQNALRLDAVRALAAAGIEVDEVICSSSPYYPDPPQYYKNIVQLVEEKCDGKDANTVYKATKKDLSFKAACTLDQLLLVKDVLNRIIMPNFDEGRVLSEEEQKVIAQKSSLIDECNQSIERLNNYIISGFVSRWLNPLPKNYFKELGDLISACYKYCDKFKIPKEPAKQDMLRYALKNSDVIVFDDFDEVHKTISNHATLTGTRMHTAQGIEVDMTRDQSVEYYIDELKRCGFSSGSHIDAMKSTSSDAAPKQDQLSIQAPTMVQTVVTSRRPSSVIVASANPNITSTPPSFFMFCPVQSISPILKLPLRLP